MSRLYTERRSVFIAGTTILGATVAVLDWLSKIFSLKVPFPPLIFLKFDVIGIPAIIAYLLFGLLSGVVTCSVAFISISFRDPFSGFMKCLAELATVIGAFITLRVSSQSGTLHKGKKIFAGVSSVISRVAVMAIVNFLLLPIFRPAQTELDLIVICLVSLFNAIQGTISIVGGFLVYEAVTLRLPSLRAARNEA